MLVPRTRNGSPPRCAGFRRGDVAERGGRRADYREQDGQRVMKQSEITVRVGLHRGSHEATIWTCDLSVEYVKINADYRS